MLPLTRQQKLGAHYGILGSQAVLCEMPHAAKRYLDCKDILMKVRLDDSDMDSLEETAVEAYAILREVSNYLFCGGNPAAVERLDCKAFGRSDAETPVSNVPQGSSEEEARSLAEEFATTGRGGSA